MVGLLIGVIVVYLLFGTAAAVGLLVIGSGLILGVKGLKWFFTPGTILFLAIVWVLDLAYSHTYPLAVEAIAWYRGLPEGWQTAILSVIVGGPIGLWTVEMGIQPFGLGRKKLVDKKDE